MFDIDSAECGLGWHPIIERFQRRLDALNMRRDAPISIVDAKEKHGRLRLDLSPFDGEAWNLAMEAEHESRTTCETCGGPGEIKVERDILKCRCAECP